MKYLLPLITAFVLLGCVHHTPDPWCNSSHWRNCRQMYIEVEEDCVSGAEVQPKDGSLTCSHPSHKMIQTHIFPNSERVALLCVCMEKE